MIHDFRKAEAIQVPIGGRTSKRDVAYAYGGPSLNQEQGGSSDTRYDLREPGGALLSEIRQPQNDKYDTLMLT